MISSRCKSPSSPKRTTATYRYGHPQLLVCPSGAELGRLCLKVQSSAGLGMNSCSGIQILLWIGARLCIHSTHLAVSLILLHTVSPCFPLLSVLPHTLLHHTLLQIVSLLNSSFSWIFPKSSLFILYYCSSHLLFFSSCKPHGGYSLFSPVHYSHLAVLKE